ncbi:hypothetical protein D3C76_1003140 [compost metagenome]
MQRLATTYRAVTAQTAQGFTGNRCGQAAEITEDGLCTLPRLGVLGTALAPGLHGAVVGLSGGTRLQLHQPVSRFAQDQRVNALHHHSMLRQARNAVRMSRLIVISETCSCSAIWA